MRKLIVSLITLSMVGIATPAGLAEDGASANLEFVANVAFGEATHMEFLVQDGRTYAVAGARDSGESGVYIVDVTDPENPMLTGHLACPNGGNADIGLFPNLDLLVFTVDSNGSDATGCFTPGGYQFQMKNIGLVDISDLTNPVMLGSPPYANGLSGIHTIVVHPTENIAYLSDQETPHRGPLMKILDLTALDPANPDPLDGQIVTAPMPRVGSGPHDTTFSSDGERAYVSAVTASYILDTTDPLNPTVLSHIVNPAINIHHEGMLSPDGRYLFVVDELTGATAWPQCPGGGVHVYDLGPDLDGNGHGDLEIAPVEVGVFHADDTRNLAHRITEDDKADPVCTAHEGNFSPDGGLFSLAWFEAGSRIFDTSSFVGQELPPGTPISVTEVAFNREASTVNGRPVVDNWASKIHPNAPDYVIATNQISGLDIFKMTGDLAS